MAARANGSGKDVLLVEDNEADAVLVRRCFERRTPQHHIHVAKDATQAHAFLRQEHPFQRAPRPSLVLLDLNLPKVGGHELLARIKHDSVLRTIAIVVLSSSDAGSDITRSYDLGANAYLVKPISLQELRMLVGCIDRLWLH
jgi:two-component system, chemotaxis family, response regulator Rcp1